MRKIATLASVSILQKTHQFAIRYERHLSVLSMAVGFLLDNTFLRRADLGPETLLLYFYLASSGLLIFGIHLAEEGVWKGKYALSLRPWLPILLQGISGSMFSAFLVFYGRSASLLASWPFLLVLFLVFAGTEIFHSYHDRLAFQSAIYFFGIFSFCIYTVPLLVGRIGEDVFFLSGLAAFFIFAIFFALLFFTGPKRLRASALKISAAVGAVFLLINVFYFTHLLPPLPLSLRDIGVYHVVAKTNIGYVVFGEQESWLSDFLGVTDVHILPGQAVYVYSSVFTPIVIKTDVVHLWEYWNSTKGVWVQNTRIEFPVVGGADGGYPGFSEIDGIPPGLWRVSVETPDGRLIGRVEFTVEYVSVAPSLTYDVL